MKQLGEASVKKVAATVMKIEAAIVPCQLETIPTGAALIFLLTKILSNNNHRLEGIILEMNLRDLGKLLFEKMDEDHAKEQLPDS